MAVLSYQVLACNMDIRASAHARLHMFMQKLQKITVFIQENGKVTSETQCPNISATFLWMIRMFGWSFESSRESAPLNLQLGVSGREVSIQEVTLFK